MGHFAKVDDNNIVTNVIVAKKEFIDRVYPNEKWIKTSYNTKGGVHYQPNSHTPSEDQSKALRKNYAGIGCVYDPKRDAFYQAQPFPSWTLNEDTCQWEPPVAHPDDEKMYQWNEETQTWDKING
tara:strand:- start:1105 stop:1479 length:375 start_codon:yes stop_codon:yes gene_type:complete